MSSDKDRAIRRRFQGIYPVLYAYFDEAGRLDHGAMRVQVEHCLEAGAHGIVVLGLVTEVHRIASEERREIVELVGRILDGRVPYAVTVAEQDAEKQIAFARMAMANGADWVILQPPPGKGHDDEALQAHFGRIADALDCPVAIQNNPVNLDSSLTPGGLTTLVKRHANITLLKAEGWSVEIARVIASLDGEVDAFGGHGGLELLSLLRSGGTGLIPAPDCLAIQVAMFEALTSGDPEAVALAERLHKEILPLIVFMTRALPSIICYGKRVMATRLGIEAIHDRSPVIAPTEFGLAEMERLFAEVLRTERELLPILQKRLAAMRDAASAKAG